MLDVVAAESLNLWDGPTAAFVILAVHVAVPLTMASRALSQARRAKREAEQARARWAPGSAVAPGASVVVHGQVEYAPGANAALRVEVEQLGSEQQSKGKWSHIWSEVARNTTAEPFYVRDVRGVRVRVEPDERTLLLDKLDRVVPHGEKRRKRIAELSSGEEVFVLGELAGASGGAYRSAGEPVMRAPKTGPLVVAAEPLEERFRRTHADQRWAGRALLVLAMFVLLFDVGYYVRSVFGVADVAEVTAARVVRGKRGAAKCALDLTTPSGATFTDSAPPGLCGYLLMGGKLQPGRRVPIIDPRLDGWFAQVGTRPGNHFVSVLMGAIFVGLGALAYASRSRPWYESKVTDFGQGRLPDV